LQFAKNWNEAMKDKMMDYFVYWFLGEFLRNFKEKMIFYFILFY
jgi:hypothetical protein